MRCLLLSFALLACGSTQKSTKPSLQEPTVSLASEDPYNPQTWTDKLNDVSELEEAITTLERLGCPEAIEPLGKVWEKHNKWSRVLRVMIALADQPEMEKGYENYPNDNCKYAGEGPYWHDAIPFLIKAVEDFDVTDEQEIQDAAIAAEALGKSKSDEATSVLIVAATKQEKLRHGQMVRIAAIAALGEFGEDPRAVDALIRVLETKATRETIRINAACSGVPPAIA